MIGRKSNKFCFSSLKSIKTGSNASSEAAFSPWSDKPLPIIDDYHGVPLRSLYKNNVYEDEPIAYRELFAPNVNYEEAKPHSDLNRASTSYEAIPLENSPRTSTVGPTFQRDQNQANGVQRNLRISSPDE